jgi:hypothetical protein
VDALYDAYHCRGEQDAGKYDLLAVPTTAQYTEQYSEGLDFVLTCLPVYTGNHLSVERRTEVNS